MPQRRPWTSQQDKILKQLREEKYIIKWSLIAKTMADQYHMPIRTGKQCRQRYHNYLDSTILRTEWTQQEEQYLYQLHSEVGNKWAIIAQKLNGRTDNCVKNHFYSKMRKGIRKLNKIIYQNYKKQIKQIKMTMLYKIIQATDQKFKNKSNIQLSISNQCCKLKNLLLIYSNDQNILQNNLQLLAQLAKEIHDFNTKYRRKSKKIRKYNLQHHHIVKPSKILQKPIISLIHPHQLQSQFSIAISHQCDNCDDDNSLQMNNLTYHQLKQQYFLTQTLNKLQIICPIIERPQLIKPPTMSLSQTRANIQDSEQLQQYLRDQGIVQDSLQLSKHIKYSGAFKQVSIKLSQSKGEESGSLEQFYQGNGFLGQSVEKIRMCDINLDGELQEDNKLFVSI